MKTVPMRPLRITLDEPKCANCDALAETVRRLTEENDRLKRALQRESYHMDQRVIRNK